MSLSLSGAKLPGYESPRERKFHGANVPGSESSTYGGRVYLSYTTYADPQLALCIRWSKWLLQAATELFHCCLCCSLHEEHGSRVRRSRWATDAAT